MVPSYKWRSILLCAVASTSTRRISATSHHTISTTVNSSCSCSSSSSSSSPSSSPPPSSRHYINYHAAYDVSGFLFHSNSKCNINRPSTSSSRSTSPHLDRNVRKRNSQRFAYLAPNSFSTLSRSESIIPSMISIYHPRTLITKRNMNASASCDSSNNESDEQITNKTLDWIKKVVIGLNLCPFADKPFKESKLFSLVQRGGNDRSNEIGDSSFLDDILASVLYESMKRKNEEGTTVVICPDLYPTDFVQYLNVLSMVEAMLVDYELDGYVQVAPFHPLFEFQGSGQDGVDNFTNRSPYPMFHILRESEVSIAVNKLGGDSSVVWQRNVTLMKNLEDALGRDKTEMVMKGEQVEGVQDVLRKTRIEEDYEYHRSAGNSDEGKNG